jgi:hypothetical protein
VIYFDPDVEDINDVFPKIRSIDFQEYKLPLLIMEICMAMIHASMQHYLRRSFIPKETCKILFDPRGDSRHKLI